jgi:hypothetical protein
MENKNEFVEIYAGELWQSSMIRNLLEDNGIPSFVENELMGTIDPSLITSGGIAPVKINIKNSDLARAKELIDELNNADFSIDEEQE